MQIRGQTSAPQVRPGGASSMILHFDILELSLSDIEIALSRLRGALFVISFLLPTRFPAVPEARPGGTSSMFFDLTCYLKVEMNRK